MPPARPLRTALCLALALLTLAPTARAQREEATVPRRVDVSFSAGGLASTDWSDLVVIGTDGLDVGRVLVRDVAVRPGGLVDLDVTYWRGPYGVRFHVGYGESCLAIGGGCVADVLPDRLADTLVHAPGSDRVNTWLYDISAVVGLRPPVPGRIVLPYLVGGVGGVTYDPGAAIRNVLPSFVEVGDRAGRLRPAADGTLVLAPIAHVSEPLVVAVDEIGLETALAGVLGLGTQLRLPIGRGGIGLRIEATDHIIDSPLDARIIRLRRDFGLDFFGFDAGGGVDDVEIDFGRVHNLRLVIGLVVRVPLRPTVPARLLRIERGRRVP